VRTAKSQSLAPAFEAFVYVSRAENFSPGDLPELVKGSQNRNAAYGLSSVLILSNGRFLQYVEGPPVPLLRLWNRLQHDPRHTAVKLLHYAPTDSRRFEAWPLKHVAAKIDVAAISKLGRTPAALRSDAAVSLILELLPLRARARTPRAVRGT
jgi:hypothetical protein